MFDLRNGLWGLVSAITLSLGGCLSGGCTRAFSEASLGEQIEAFKQTTEHLVNLAERTDAAYTAEFEYDGEDAEAYLKQSAGLRIPIRIRLGVFGNAKSNAGKEGAPGGSGAGSELGGSSGSSAASELGGATGSSVPHDSSAAHGPMFEQSAAFPANHGTSPRDVAKASRAGAGGNVDSFRGGMREPARADGAGAGSGSRGAG